MDSANKQGIKSPPQPTGRLKVGRLSRSITKPASSSSKKIFPDDPQLAMQVFIEALKDPESLKNSSKKIPKDVGGTPQSSSIRNKVTCVNESIGPPSSSSNSIRPHSLGKVFTGKDELESPNNSDCVSSSSLRSGADRFSINSISQPSFSTPPGLLPYSIGANTMTSFIPNKVFQPNTSIVYPTIAIAPEDQDLTQNFQMRLQSHLMGTASRSSIKYANMGPCTVTPCVVNSVPPSVDETVMKPVPDGTKSVKYPAPDKNALIFDPTLGYRYDCKTGLHYDANSGYFFNSKLKVFLRYDFFSHSYLRVENPSIPFPVLKSQSDSAERHHIGENLETSGNNPVKQAQQEIQLENDKISQGASPRCRKRSDSVSSKVEDQGKSESRKREDSPSRIDEKTERLRSPKKPHSPSDRRKRRSSEASSRSRRGQSKRSRSPSERRRRRSSRRNQSRSSHSPSERCGRPSPSPEASYRSRHSRHSSSDRRRRRSRSYSPPESCDRPSSSSEALFRRRLNRDRSRSPGCSRRRPVSRSPHRRRSHSKSPRGFSHSWSSPSRRSKRDRSVSFDSHKRRSPLRYSPSLTRRREIHSRNDRSSDGMSRKSDDAIESHSLDILVSVPPKSRWELEEMKNSPQSDDAIESHSLDILVSVPPKSRWELEEMKNSPQSSSEMSSTEELVDCNNKSDLKKQSVNNDVSAPVSLDKFHMYLIRDNSKKFKKRTEKLENCLSDSKERDHDPRGNYKTFPNREKDVESSDRRTEQRDREKTSSCSAIKNENMGMNILSIPSNEINHSEPRASDHLAWNLLVTSREFEGTKRLTDSPGLSDGQSVLSVNDVENEGGNCEEMTEEMLESLLADSDDDDPVNQESMSKQEKDHSRSESKRSRSPSERCRRRSSEVSCRSRRNQSRSSHSPSERCRRPSPSPEACYRSRHSRHSSSERRRRRLSEVSCRSRRNQSRSSHSPSERCRRPPSPEACYRSTHSRHSSSERRRRRLSELSCRSRGNQSRSSHSPSERCRRPPSPEACYRSRHSRHSSSKRRRRRSTSYSPSDRCRRRSRSNSPSERRRRHSRSYSPPEVCSRPNSVYSATIDHQSGSSFENQNLTVIEKSALTGWPQAWDIRSSSSNTRFDGEINSVACSVSEYVSVDGQFGVPKYLRRKRNNKKRRKKERKHVIEAVFSNPVPGDTDPFSGLYLSNATCLVHVKPSVVGFKTDAIKMLLQQHLKLVYDVKYKEISWRKCGVGSSFGYFQIAFDSLTDSKVWFLKTDRTITFQYAPGVEADFYLYYAGEDWRCANCSTLNIFFRSLCWKCYCHKNGSFTAVKFTNIPTRFLAFCMLPCSINEYNFMRYLPKMMETINLKRVYIFEDPCMDCCSGLVVVEFRSVQEAMFVRIMTRDNRLRYVEAFGSGENLCIYDPFDGSQPTVNENCGGAGTFLDTGVPGGCDPLSNLYNSKPTCIVHVKPALKFGKHIPIVESLMQQLSDKDVNIKNIIRPKLRSTGSPFDYLQLEFESLTEAEQLLLNTNRRISVHVGQPPRQIKLDYFLCYADENWTCNNCVPHTLNIFLRSVCHVCYRHKSGSTHVRFSDAPTRFLGFGKLSPCVNARNIMLYLPVEIVTCSFKSVNIIEDPKMKCCCGVAVVEMPSVEEAVQMTQTIKSSGPKTTWSSGPKTLLGYIADD